MEKKVALQEMNCVVGELEGDVLRLHTTKGLYNDSDVRFGKQSLLDKVAIRRERLRH